jgi:hypothetical protein
MTTLTAPTAAFDIDAYEDVTSADVRIKDPKTGANTAMVVTLAGPEHPDRKRISYAKSRRLRAALAKTGKLPTTDPEDDEADDLELLVTCTLGWVGASVPYSRDNVRKVYADPKRRWLRDQVFAALNERETFTQASVHD